MGLYKYIGFARGLLGSLLVLGVLLALAYACFCVRAGDLGQLEDGHRVILFGRVRAAYGVDPQQQAYELEDPSGTVFVATERGLPQPGTVLLLRGTKKSTLTSRPIVIEELRAGSF